MAHIFIVRYKVIKDKNSDKVINTNGEWRFAAFTDSVCQWGEDRNITSEGGATSYTQIPKLIEEVYEFRDAKTEEEAKLEFGDILVVCIQIARLRGFDLDECLVLAYDKIKIRTGRMEKGVFIKDAN